MDSGAPQLQQQKTLKIASTHPSLPGHFPGRAIVPGVVLLDEVLRAAEKWLGSLKVKGLRQAKFLSPLLPEIAAEMQLSCNDTKLNFVISVNSNIIVQGSFEVQRT